MRLREWFVAGVILALAACTGGGGGGARSSASNEDGSDASAAELMVQLGQGYLQQDKLDLARDKLQKAIQLDPKSVHANTMLGVLNERVKRPELAEKFYRKAVQLAPEDGQVNNNLGTFLCGSGRAAQSLEWFDKALDDPYYKTPWVALANAGVCAGKTGNLARAEDSFRRVLEFQPQSAVALYELARLNVGKGDYLRARAFQQRLEAVDVVSPEVFELGADIETRLGNVKAAEGYRERLRRDFPDYQTGQQPASASTGQQQ